jgi:arylformamidase
MITSIQHQGNLYHIDLSKPIDISILMRPAENCVRAWYVDPIRIEPVMANGFVGDVNLGGAVNFKNIFFNPHGNGTHTECVGHISKEPYYIHQCLEKSFFVAQLITVIPEKINNDDVITKKHFENKILPNTEAIIIRTLPNTQEKTQINYSNTNPTYMDVDAVDYLTNNGVNHILIDLPSVDKEEDGGELRAHHAFWGYPNNIHQNRTITELIYVPSEVEDGAYMLNIQIVNFENDASPSKPLLYPLI